MSNTYIHKLKGNYGRRFLSTLYKKSARIRKYSHGIVRGEIETFFGNLI